MNKSRLITYAVGGSLALIAAIVYLTTKNLELTASLSTASAFVLGFAKQHPADRPRPEKLPAPAPDSQVAP